MNFELHFCSSNSLGGCEPSEVLWDRARLQGRSRHNCESGFT